MSVKEFITLELKTMFTEFYELKKNLNKALDKIESLEKRVRELETRKIQVEIIKTNPEPTYNYPYHGHDMGIDPPYLKCHELK